MQCKRCRSQMKAYDIEYVENGEYNVPFRCSHCGITDEQVMVMHEKLGILIKKVPLSGLVLNGNGKK